MILTLKIDTTETSRPSDLARALRAISEEITYHLAEHGLKPTPRKLGSYRDIDDRRSYSSEWSLTPSPDLFEQHTGQKEPLVDAL